MTRNGAWGWLLRALAPGVRAVRAADRDRAPEPEVLYVREVGDAAAYGVMQCPCGCGETVRLRFFGDRPPRWRFRVDVFGRVTVEPSIWRSTGCRSHFWLRRGRIVWCVDP